MRKLAMLLLVVIALTAGSVAYAEPLEPYFDEDLGLYFLNPQPLPP